MLLGIILFRLDLILFVLVLFLGKDDLGVLGLGVFGIFNLEDGGYFVFMFLGFWLFGFGLYVCCFGIDFCGGKWGFFIGWFLLGYVILVRLCDYFGVGGFCKNNKSYCVWWEWVKWFF